MVNLSGTITTGGSAQVLTGVNPNRIGLAIQNVSAGDLFVNFMTTATASSSNGSIKIASGVWFEAPFFNDNPQLIGGAGCGTVSIFGATTGQAFAAMEW